jgi:RNA polymerase sigma factor (sigma-70 family)
MPAPPLDANAFARMSPFVRRELRRLTLAGAPSAALSLRNIFEDLYGANRSHEELIRFMVFAAPLARRVLIELASSGDRIGETDISADELTQWLWWLETFDPLSARLVDLYYFAGLTTREAAEALNMSPQSVVQDLRFARAWLRARL